MKIEESPKMFGAYVESISASIGWNGQGGSCQMTLVEDPDNDIIINLPPVGTACYFKYKSFYYGGIFQRWTYKEEINGKKYDIVLESPGGKILNGVGVILGGFEGTHFNEGAGYNKFKPYLNPNFTTEIKNVWNPYGHKENHAFGGRFGAANTNSAGFLAGELLELLEEISRGESSFGGKIEFGESEYTLDVGKLKEVTPYFRIAGQSATLNSIFQECSEILQYDYFASVESESVKSDNLDDGGGDIKDPVIKIITIDKTKQPNSGAVKQKVKEAFDSGLLASSDFGQELSDEVTSRIVVGGPASRYYMANINECVPVWGKLGPKSYLLAPNFNRTSAAYQPNASVPILLDEMSEIGGGGTASILSGYFGNTYTATVTELRMSLGGMEAWLTFKVFESFAKGTYEKDPWVAGIEVTPVILRQLANGEVGALSLAATSLAGAKKAYNPETQEYIKKVFDRVSKTANEFYGRMFLVPLPYEPGGLSNNLKFVEEDLVEVASWDISSDAWVSNKPINDINFYNNGRMKPVSVYPFAPNSDFSEMGSDYASFINRNPLVTGISTSKTGFQDPNVFFLPQIAPNAFVVADAGLQVRNFDQYTTTDAGITFLSKYFFNIDVDPSRYLTPGKSSNANIPVHPAIEYPEWIGVPQQSIRYSWGPWYKSGDSKGKSEISIDSNLVPENFGSVELMNQAGQDAAGAGVATLSAHESGRIELAQFPEFSIAERFNNSGPYVTGMTISVSSGGVTTSYEFNTWTPNFGKLTKYNSDRISRIYKATLEAFKRIAQDNPKRAFKPIQFGKGDFKEKGDRQKSERDSAEFSLFRGFQGGFQGSQIRTADALALSLGNIFNSFGCSEDQKWSPVGIRSERTDEDTGVYVRKPVSIPEEQGGIFNEGSCVPTNVDLDPYYALSDQGDFVAVVNTDENGETSDINLKKAQENGNIAEIRTVGLRAPTLVSGWGFDQAGNPVPHADGDVTKLHENPTDRNNWYTGEINLMFDKERGTWTGGLDVLSGLLATDIESPTTPLEPTTFSVSVLRKDSDVETKGSGALSLSGETITCYNRDTSLSQRAGSDVFVIIMRINYEWTPIWVGCP